MELEELVRYCEYENLYLVAGCYSKAHPSVWCSTKCNSRGGNGGISKFFKFGDLNAENNPTCSCGKLNVIDNTLESLRLLEFIVDWEVLSELSLSDHRYILFTMRGS
jgi:hypothetical protein